MTKTIVFDLIVVYSDKYAASSNSMKVNTIAPFAQGSKTESYNTVYGYFLRTCQKYKLKAAFTTSSDIIGAGKCKSFWLFKKGAWMKVQNPAFSKFIFDKVSPTNKRSRSYRKLLFSSPRIKAFNNRHIFNLCFDKQKTYNKLRKFSIPTVSIKDNTKKSILQTCDILKKKMNMLPNKTDFSDELIVKDRFGAGGKNVYKFKTGSIDKMLKTVIKHNSISFIIQPFAIFNKGYIFKNVPVSADIRVIFIGKKIVQTYVRIAKTGDFRCNEHQGGLLKYIPINKAPLEVIKIAKTIAKKLNQSTSLFALDFIITNNGNVFLLEANTGPGLDWNLSIKENEIQAKKLIRIIVQEIFKIIYYKNTFPEKNIGIPKSNTFKKSTISYGLTTMEGAL